MKKRRIVIRVAVVLSVLFIGIFCYSELKEYKTEKEGERLANIYCTSCHIYPEPDLLTKQVWRENVLPNMASRMGYRLQNNRLIVPDLDETQPIVSTSEWQKIVQFYLNSAPVKLPKIKHDDLQVSDQFQTESITDSLGGIVTLIKKEAQALFIAEVSNQVLLRNSQEIYVDGPVTDVNLKGDTIFITNPRLLHPNDLPSGIIVKQWGNQKEEIILDSLFRPLQTIFHDLNQDGNEDILICEFGNNIGALTWYEDTELGFQRHQLSDTPGAVSATIKDFNQDGLDDIMVLFAQGDERINIYYNNGKGNFKEETIYRFSPVYGSLKIDVMDFDNDNDLDILYTNGDNGDYSNIPKHYHGVRLLLNNGNNQFQEQFFYPLYGAAQARGVDFDQDQDTDIIITSTFTKSGQPSPFGIIYLENLGDWSFEPSALSKAGLNQWNVMEILDWDTDGDMDVIVGAMNIESVRAHQNQPVTEKGDAQASLLLLRNMLQ